MLYQWQNNGSVFGAFTRPEDAEQFGSNHFNGEGKVVELRLASR